MYVSNISYEYLGGAPINCTFSIGDMYYCMGSHKRNKHFYIDDNLNVRVVDSECFKPVEKQIRIVVSTPKDLLSTESRSRRMELCDRWEITEPTFKDWFETRPFLLNDAVKGLNKRRIKLDNLPELAQSSGNYLCELACRWGYFNPQSINRMINDGRRLKLFSDAFNGLLK